MARKQIPETIKNIIRAHGEKIELHAGNVLFHKGDNSRAVYFVESGSLKVHTGGMEQQDDIILNIILPGQITGEIGSITGWPRIATLTAKQETTVIQLSQQTFQTILQQAPALATIVMETTGSYLVSADADRVSLGRSYQYMQKRILALGEEKGQLREVLRLREEMESMLVHDLRNPLSVLQTGFSLLENLTHDRNTTTSIHQSGQIKDKKAFDTTLGLMETATKRMQNLVNTLLDVAKMEAGRSILNLKTMPLDPFIQNLLNEQKTLTTENDIALLYNAEERVMVHADKDVLYRVMVNLMDNALKFTPPGGTINIDVKKGKNWTLVSILDSGPGIPEEERTRVFEKFTQIKTTTTSRQQRGTGLGLTFCKMAVEAHGGQIWVENGPNNMGAWFKIKLPSIISDTPQ